MGLYIGTFQLAVGNESSTVLGELTGDFGG